MENRGIFVKELGTEVLSFHDNLMDFKGEKRGNLSFQFAISPDNGRDRTHYIVDIVYQISDRATGSQLVRLLTRSTFQLSKFNKHPNIAILEEFVYNSYVEHRNIFSKLKSTLEHLKNEDQPQQLYPELFEASLTQQFKQAFPDS